MGSIVQTVAALLGEAQVTPWEALADLQRQRIAAAIVTDPLPAAIVYPDTAEQLAAVVACAHQNQWRLLPCGQGSKLSWGGLLRGIDLVVSTQRLTRLVDHAVGDLTVTAEAGIPFITLQQALQDSGQWLAIDPAYPQRATLGGIVATRDTGALRQRYGGIRDLLIGVSFVRHDGQLARAGGRVVKNVAGYDLMKLLTGSFGTLGILTQLTFRTHPQQDLSQTVVLRGQATAIRAVTATVRQSPLTPVALDLLSPGLLANDEAAYGLAVRFQSVAAGVAEQVERLQAIAVAHDLTSAALTAAAEMQFWQGLTARLFPDPPLADWAIVGIGIRPAEAVDLLQTMAALWPAGTWQARIHAGSGLGTLHLAVTDDAIATLAQLRSHCQVAGGHLTLRVTPPTWKQQLDPWGIPEATRQLMQRLRQQFDPQLRLSPGRWG